jgi:DNA-binding beta-propeller fold protein YncE
MATTAIIEEKPNRMRVSKVLIATTRCWPIRLIILLGLMMLVVFGRSERNHPATAMNSGSFSPALDASEIFSNTCMMPAAEQPYMASAPVESVANGSVMGGDIPPTRYVMDPYPTFNGMAVDGLNGKVLMSDANRKGLLLYDRMTSSHAGEETPPQRHITGSSTLLGYVSGVAFDSERREVYGVNNDTEDNLAVFSYDDEGDLKPKRVLAVPHQAWGIALNRSRDELALTVETPNAVVIYRREAKGLEAPLRHIRGSSTGLADPHGISWDQVNKEITVANHGNKPSAGFAFVQDASAATNQTLGGQVLPPSITVYSETAEGDAKSLRTIQGARTQLAWPMGLEVDGERNEIAVANNGDNSVLIFRRTASGDVAPVRVIRGPRTGIDRPMGVGIDRQNDELWVANFGNHSAVVFGRTASGNIAPKRTIRNAPAGTPTAGFGNPMAVAYDAKREEVLVPN